LQSNYRKLFIARKIKIFDKKQNGLDPKEIDIGKAIKFVSEAWKNVTSITISNCWMKTGIIPLDYEGQVGDATTLIQNVTHDQKNDIDNLINRLNFSSALTAEEYISIDDDKIDKMPTEEEILSAFEQVEDKDVIDSITTPNVSINEAAKAFETAFNFLEQNNVQADYNELKAFKSLKKKIELYRIQNASQTTITSFFK
jgi:hypothetical protein